MIPGLDSAQPPTAAQVAAARAAGYRLWSGYIATRPRVNLLNVWSQADFEVARECGSTPIAFCSGWDDPVGCRELAAAWNVRLCLDVESGIRGDGPWVQPWLDASGAGLYGSCGVHSGRSAAFHVLAWYPTGGPIGATWYDGPCPRPAGPCGWQSQGSHQEFGVDVDAGWYDDWYGGDAMALDPNDPVVQQITGTLSHLETGLLSNLAPPGAGPDALNARLIAERAGTTALQVELDALKAELEAGTQIDVGTAINRLEAALKSAGQALGGA